MRWVKREENVADLGTKALSKAVISKHCITLGVCQYDERVEVPSKTCTLTMPSRQASRRSSFLRTHTSTVGIARHLQEEENVILARGVGATSVHVSGQATGQGLFARSSKTTARYLGSRLTWNMSFAKARGTRIAAAWNTWRMLGDCWKAPVNFKCQMQCVGGNCAGCVFSGFRAFAGQNGSVTEIVVVFW